MPSNWYAKVPNAAVAAISDSNDPAQSIGDRWSASMHVCHPADVFADRTERLLTLAHDPGYGIACWMRTPWPKRGVTSSSRPLSGWSCCARRHNRTTAATKDSDPRRKVWSRHSSSGSSR
jgi:hypothetical protein